MLADGGSTLTSKPKIVVAPVQAGTAKYNYQAFTRARSHVMIAQGRFYKPPTERAVGPRFSFGSSSGLNPPRRLRTDPISTKKLTTPITSQHTFASSE